MNIVRKAVCGVVLTCSIAGSAQNIKVDPQIPSYKPVTGLTGELHVTGGGRATFFALMPKWVEMFKTVNPGVKVTYMNLLEDASFQSMSFGDTQLTIETIPAVYAHTEHFSTRLHYEPLAVDIGLCTDVAGNARSSPMGIYVAKDNPLKGLTLAQVDAIFSQDRLRGYREPIKEWGQLGLTGEWTHQPIHLYGPRPIESEDGGTPRLFRSLVTKDGPLRTDIARLFDENIVNQIVAADKYGLSYTTYDAEVAHPVPGVRRVPIAADDHSSYSDGSFEEVAAGKYPLTRTMIAYLDKKPGKPVDPVTKEFLRMILSKEGQSVLIERQILPLTATQVKASLAKLE